MGNIIGTIQWIKTDKDDIYINELEKLRKKYDLNYDDTLGGYDKNMNRYTVGMSGLWILWYGEKYINYKVKLFLEDASKFFTEMNINNERYQEFLPM